MTYTPAPDFFGTDSFGYTIDDGNGGTATASINITVNVVDNNPVANNDTITVNQDSVDNAINVLTFSNKKAAGIIKKVLESAIANAEHNDAADVDELCVSTITVDEGPTIKRWRPRARGRANQIFKRMSHVTIQVEEVGQ